MLKCYDIEKYNDYVQKYIDISIQNNNKIGSSRLSQYDLPDYRWFVKHCPDKTVKNWKDFLIWIGFYSPLMPKEQASVLILNYSKQVDRPLMYDDFRGTNPLVPGISYINNTWGTMNKMKEELGLEIIQDNMIERHLSKQEFVDEMDKIFKYAQENNIVFITRSFIDGLKQFNKTSSLDKYSKEYFNVGLADYIKQCGYMTGNPGCGCVYVFDDGEKTYSQYEYLFSKYLRELGFVYNIDYFRNVRYSTFIDDYNGMMDCDYVINYNNYTIYIEIPGIIEYYKIWYYRDQPITRSKSKEKYRLKLKEKELLLSNSNLNYFILFPCDLTMGNLINILHNPSSELREEIEKFANYNIDWQEVLKYGQLKYSPIIRRKRNPVVYQDNEKEDDKIGTNS